MVLNFKTNTIDPFSQSDVGVGQEGESPSSCSSVNLGGSSWEGRR